MTEGNEMNPWKESLIKRRIKIFFSINKDHKVALTVCIPQGVTQGDF
jgi:hypothetical protein